MGRIVNQLENIADLTSLKCFPDYMISKEGKVFKKVSQGVYKTKKYEVKTFRHNVSGTLRVALNLKGKRYTRGVVSLVIDTFFPQPNNRGLREVFFIDKNDQNPALNNLKVIDF